MPRLLHVQPVLVPLGLSVFSSLDGGGGNVVFAQRSQVAACERLRSSAAAVAAVYSNIVRLRLCGGKIKKK